MRTRAILVLLLLLYATSLMLAQTADEIFRQARRTEVLDGDIPAAIRLDERVVRDSRSSRALVAQSLVHIGEAYRRINEPAKSRAAFQSIIDHYKTEREPYAIAVARLLAPNFRPNIARASGE